jgi:transposase
MIGFAGQLRVYAYGAPCDMRKSFNTLTGLVLDMGHNISAGEVFLFVAKNKKRAKVLWHDGTGLCLLAKRIDVGHFAPIWRRVDANGPLELSIQLKSCFIPFNWIPSQQVESW